MIRTTRLGAVLVAVAVPLALLTSMPAQAADLTRRACGDAPEGSVRCLSEFRTPGASARKPGGGVPLPTAGYGPADIASMYGLDPTMPGTTVAIVDAYDNPNVEADLAVFRTAYGLKPCTSTNGCFRKINQRGGTTPPAPDGGWGVEIDLDAQAVSAACPKCRILLVEADSAEFEDIAAAVDQAVAQGAKIVSNSYGGDEFTGVVELGQQHYSHPGVAMVVSSGDWGFGPASFPASWSRSIAVGGTTVQRAGRGWDHTVWWGSGSGCSAWVEKPAWQHDENCLMRTVADVSALADPDPGFAVYDSFLDDFGEPPQWIVVGGTSLSAPLIAGMIALARNPGELTDASRIYAKARNLRDVTSGSNALFNDCGGDYLCTGGPGYDAPTGMGTPRGLGAL